MLLFLLPLLVNKDEYKIVWICERDGQKVEVTYSGTSKAVITSRRSSLANSRQPNASNYHSNDDVHLKRRNILL